MTFTILSVYQHFFVHIITGTYRERKKTETNSWFNPKEKFYNNAVHCCVLLLLDHGLKTDTQMV